MKTNQSSARVAFRNFIKVGMFLLLAVVLGVGLAAGTAMFVLGHFSGAWQSEKVADQSRHLIPIRYVQKGAKSPETLATKENAGAIPAPLIAAPADDSAAATVRVARAIPVGDVPVLRARPVLLTEAPVFNVRADLADDQNIPRARAVSPRDRAGSQDQPYSLPANRDVAQRDSAALNW